MKNYILIIVIFLLNISFSNAQEKKNELFIGLSPFNGNELKSTLGTAALSLFAEDVIFKTKSIGFYTLGYRHKIEEKLIFAAAMHYTGSNISIKSNTNTIEGKNRAFIFSFGLDYTYYTNKKAQLYSGLKYVSAFPKESTVTQKSGTAQVQTTTKNSPVIGRGALTLLGFRYGHSKGIFSEIGIGTTLFSVGLFGKF